jgi:hypothetical protein
MLLPLRGRRASPTSSPSARDGSASSTWSALTPSWGLWVASGRSRGNACEPHTTDTVNSAPMAATVGYGVGVARTVTPPDTLPAPSTAQTRYPTRTEAVRPVWLKLVALPVDNTVPVAQLAGAVAPDTSV